MNPLGWGEAAVATFLVTTVVAGVNPRWRGVGLGTLLGGLLTGAMGLDGLLSGPASIQWPILPGLSIAHFSIDPLAAWGLILLGLVATAVALAAPRLLAVPGPAMAFLCLMFASIIAVLTARQALVFLIAWEVMTLAGYGLVLCGQTSPRRDSAALRYLIVSHMGVSGLFVSMAALYRATGTFDFDSYHGLAASHPSLATVAFLGAAWGFSVKAGLFPFHAWLPGAYESAPTPGTAAMSGIMSKTAAFWMLRVVFQFLGPGPAWWGIALMSLGIIAAIFGILFALQQDDLKRLLAYSSIENLGLVFVGIGAAALLLAEDEPSWAAVAGAASLLHILNHGSYKTLLFLSAASVEHATGTRRFDDLGGLARGAPWTAGLFLLGAVAISGLPPLNGFVSEWVLFQSLAAALHADGVPGVIVAATILCLVGLVGGLAVATFVKAQGATFHGQPRTANAGGARDPSTPALAALLLLGAACIVLAAAGPWVLPLLGQALGGPGNIIGSTSPWHLHLVGDLQPAPILLTFLLLTFLAWMLTGRTKPRRDLVWACGWRVPRPRATHTGRALAGALGLIFRPALRPIRTLERQLEADGTYRRPVRYTFEPRDLVDQTLYEPVPRLVVGTSRRLRIIQAGSIRLYLGYILAVLVGLLVFVAVKP